MCSYHIGEAAVCHLPSVIFSVVFLDSPLLFKKVLLPTELFLWWVIFTVFKLV
jgi:hypothetical protein